MLEASVVIPLFNKEKHIHRSVYSVLAQSFKDFELIVVDDGSTDNSFNAVKKIKDSRMRIIKQPNAGESEARNRGIVEARADLVAFLDADDEWKPDFLEVILRLRKNYPQAGAYATAYEINDGNGVYPAYNDKVVLSSESEGILDNYFRTVLSCSPLCSSAVAVPKSVFNDVGVFAAGEILGGDSDMWLRIALKYQIAISKNICAVYYKNATNRIDTGIFYPSKYRLVESGRKAISEKNVPPGMEFYLGEYINKYQFKSVAHCVLSGKREKAGVLLRECAVPSLYWKKQKLRWIFLSMIPFPLLKFIYELKKTVAELRTTAVLNYYRKDKNEDSAC